MSEAYSRAAALRFKLKKQVSSPLKGQKALVDEMTDDSPTSTNCTSTWQNAMLKCQSEFVRPSQQMSEAATSTISSNSWAFEESFVNKESLQKMEDSMVVLLNSLQVKEQEKQSPMPSPKRQTLVKRKRSDKLSPLARFAAESLQQEDYQQIQDEQVRSPAPAKLFSLDDEQLVCQKSISEPATTQTDQTQPEQAEDEVHVASPKSKLFDGGLASLQQRKSTYYDNDEAICELLQKIQPARAKKDFKIELVECTTAVSNPDESYSTPRFVQAQSDASPTLEEHKALPRKKSLSKRPRIGQETAE